MSGGRVLGPAVAGLEQQAVFPAQRAHLPRDSDVTSGHAPSTGHVAQRKREVAEGGEDVACADVGQAAR